MAHAFSSRAVQPLLMKSNDFLSCGQAVPGAVEGGCRRLLLLDVLNFSLSQ
jgi:hypothetical protein